MKRIAITLDEKTHAELKARAEIENCSIAQVIRALVDEFETKRARARGVPRARTIKLRSEKGVYWPTVM